MSDALREWVEGLHDGVIRLPRCARCATWNWYPRPVCRRCGGPEVIWVEVGNVGHVHTWTEVVQAVDTVEGLRTPYVTALVAPEGAPGVRIPMLAAACARIPTIGEEVVFEVADTAAGRTLNFCQHTC